jgi:hypothetical protein
MQYYDRISEVSTTSGTGTITLGGAATGFQSFQSRFAINNRVPYCVTDGNNWEVGLGTLTTITTIARTTVYESNNSNNLITLSGGTSSIFCTIPAFRATQYRSRGQGLAMATGFEMN